MTVLKIIYNNFIAIKNFFFLLAVSDFAWEMTPSFQLKPPNQWNANEVMDFLISWSKSTAVDLIDVNMRQFNGMDGQTLCSLTQSDFYTLDPQYGLNIYKSLQNEIVNHCK